MIDQLIDEFLCVSGHCLLLAEPSEKLRSRREAQGPASQDTELSRKGGKMSVNGGEADRKELASLAIMNYCMSHKVTKVLGALVWMNLTWHQL